MIDGPEFSDKQRNEAERIRLFLKENGIGCARKYHCHAGDILLEFRGDRECDLSVWPDGELTLVRTMGEKDHLFQYPAGENHDQKLLEAFQMELTS